MRVIHFDDDFVFAGEEQSGEVDGGLDLGEPLFILRRDFGVDVVLVRFGEGDAVRIDCLDGVGKPDLLFVVLRVTRDAAGEVERIAGMVAGVDGIRGAAIAVADGGPDYRQSGCGREEARRRSIAQKKRRMLPVYCLRVARFASGACSLRERGRGSGVGVGDCSLRSPGAGVATRVAWAGVEGLPHLTPLRCGCGVHSLYRLSKIRGPWLRRPCRRGSRRLAAGTERRGN